MVWYTYKIKQNVFYAFVCFVLVFFNFPLTLCLFVDTFKQCYHKDETIYQPHSDPAYFKRSYYASSPNICSHCISCKKEFGTDIKVTSTNVVWMCPNAHDRHHHCKESRCNSCFVKWQTTNGIGITRSRRGPCKRRAQNVWHSSACSNNQCWPCISTNGILETTP
jgi:hypothetical protein